MKVLNETGTAKLESFLRSHWVLGQYIHAVTLSIWAQEAELADPPFIVLRAHESRSGEYVTLAFDPSDYMEGE